MIAHVAHIDGARMAGPFAVEAEDRQPAQLYTVLTMRCLRCTLYGDYLR